MAKSNPFSWMQKDDEEDSESSSSSSSSSNPFSWMYEDTSEKDEKKRLEEEAAKQQEQNKAEKKDNPLRKFFGGADDVAKSVGSSVAKPFKQLGGGLAETMADLSGTSDEIRDNEEEQRKNATEGQILAIQKLKDPKLTPDQRKRWERVRDLNSEQFNEVQKDSEERSREVQERTDPRKGGASVVDIGTNIVGAGILSKGVKTGRLAKSGNELASAGSKIRQGVGFGVGAEALGSPARQYIEDEDIDLKDTLTDLAIGGVVGGGAGGVDALLTRGNRLAEKSRKAAEENAYRNVDDSADRAAAGMDNEDAYMNSITPKQKLLGDGKVTERDRLQEIDQIFDDVRGGNTNNSFGEAGPTRDSMGGDPIVETQSPDMAKRIAQHEDDVAKIDEEKQAVHAKYDDVLDEAKYNEASKNLEMEFDAEMKALETMPPIRRDNLAMAIQKEYEAKFEDLNGNYINRRQTQADLDKELTEVQQKRIDLEEKATQELEDISKRDGKAVITRQKQNMAYTPDELRELSRERKALQEKIDNDNLINFDGDVPKVDMSNPETKDEVISSIEAAQRQEPSSVKNMNAADYARTPIETLKRVGAKKEADIVEGAFEKKRKADWSDKRLHESWQDRVSDEQGQKRIFKYLDGDKGISLTPVERALAGDIRSWLKARGEAQGLTEEQMIGDYITHVFKTTSDPDHDPDLMRLLVKDSRGPKKDGTGDKKGMNMSQAERILDAPAREARNKYLKKRFGVSGYEENLFGALSAYSQASNRKIHMSPALDAVAELAGQDGLDGKTVRYLLKYNKSLAKQKADIDQVLDDFTGGKGVSVVRNIRKLSYNATLGGNISTALNNLTQATNTFTEMGFRDTGIGYVKMTKLLADASRQKAAGKRVTALDELFEEGVFDDTILQFEAGSNNIKKKILRTGDKALWAMFDASEKLNRGAAYMAAKNRGLRKKMTEDEARKYARDIVSKTQFKFNEVETPLILQSEVGKTLGQLQSFNLRQTGYLGGIAKGVAKGDIKDIARAARWAGMNIAMVGSIGVATGYEWYDGIPFVSFRGIDPPAIKAGKLVKQGVTGTDQYGEDIGTGENIDRIAKEAGALFLPAGTQVKKSLEGVAAYDRGHSETAGGRVRFPIEQNTGNAIRSSIFGQYNTPEGQTYFNKNNPIAKQMGTQGESMTDKESKLFKEASPAKQQMFYKFFDASNELPNKTKASEEVTRIRSEEGINKAQRKASEFNAQVDALYEDLTREYAGMIPKELVDYIESNKIDPGRKAIKKRKKDR